MKKPKLPNFSKWSRRERLLAVVGTVVVISVLLDRAVVNPWWKHLSFLRQEIERIEHDLVAHEKLLARREGILAQAKLYERYVQPSPGSELQMATFLKEIETLARQAQVSLEEIKPQPVAETEVYENYSFEVFSECSLDQWIRLVHLIETSPSLFEIQKAKLSVKEGKTDVLSGYLLIGAVAMRAPEPPATPAPPAASPAAASTPAAP